MSRGHIHHFYGQDYVIRRLTTRECANLQGLPPQFVLHNVTTTALFQIGNGVPVPIVHWIVKAINEQYVGKLQPASKGPEIKAAGGPSGTSPAASKPRPARKLPKTPVLGTHAAEVAAEFELLKERSRKDKEPFTVKQVDALAERVGKIHIK